MNFFLFFSFFTFQSLSSPSLSLQTRMLGGGSILSSSSFTSSSSYLTSLTTSSLLANNRRKKSSSSSYSIAKKKASFINKKKKNITTTMATPKTTEEEAAHPNENGEKITNASCYCGKIKMEILGKPIAVSICHCTVCRRLSGGAFSLQSLHSQKNFTCAATENDLWSIQSSPNVTRYRCKECGSPVYATLGKGKTYVVPRSALTNIAKDDQSFKPTHHMHYKERCIDIEDELPKFVGTSAPGRAEIWNPSLD